MNNPVSNNLSLKLSQRPASASFCEYRSESMECHIPSRRRTTTRVSEIGEFNSKKISLLKFCEVHTQKFYEYFCDDHSELCCSECFTSIHKSCLNFRSLESAAVGAKCSQEFKITLKRLADTEIRLEERIGDGNTEFSPVVMEKFGKHPGIYTAHYKNENENLSHFLSKVREYRDLYGFIERNGSEIQAFLIMHVSIKIIDQIDKQVPTKDQNAKHSKLSLKRLSLKRIKTTDSGLSVGGMTWHSDDSLASPSIDRTLTYPPADARRKSPNTNRVHLAVEKHAEQIRFLKDIELTMVGHVSVYGLTKTDDNMLLLCDSCRPRILVCNSMDQYLYQITTRYEPWDIAIFPDTHFAVTSSTQDDHHAIQFIDITKKVFSKDVKLKHSEQGGITIANRSIFVCSENKLHLLDYKGHKLKKLSGLPCKSHYLNTHQSDRIILFTGQDLLSISPDGCVNFTLTTPDFVSPGKPAVDDDGNVYFPDLLSHNIYKISTKKNSICTVLTSQDGIYFPTAVTMDRKCSKLYVANNAGNSIRVFEINVQ